MLSAKSVNKRFIYLDCYFKKEKRGCQSISLKDNSNIVDIFKKIWKTKVKKIGIGFF